MSLFQYRTLPRSTENFVSLERDTDNSSLSGSIKGRRPFSSIDIPSTIAESPLRETAAEAQETFCSSPLVQPITFSEATLPLPVEDAQSPTGYIPPPVIDSTVGEPGAFSDDTDELPQPEIVQDPQPVAPHIEPVTLNPPEPAEPEAIITEALADEPASYLGKPMVESIKDFEPVNHANNMTEFSEAVHRNADDIPLEPHHEQNGEAAEYYRGDVISTTGDVVPENANVVLPEPNLGQRKEYETHPHDDAVPVVTEPERQEETQQPIPVLVPIPKYPMNLGLEREVWGGEHDHGAYPSSVPVVNPSSEDAKRVERSPAPNIGFVDCILFRELVPKSNPHLECHL